MRTSSRIEFQLDEALARRNRSRYWLAQKTGMTETQFYRLANGLTGGLKFETLRKICDALDCEPGELLVRVKR